MMNSTELHNGEKISDSIIFQPYFLICKSCFWCASCVYNHYKINKCPICNDNTTIESIPISTHEAYRFEFDGQRGLTVEFFPIGMA